MAQEKLTLLMELKNKLFNSKLSEVQKNYSKATTNLKGKAVELNMANAKAFGALTDQFPSLQRGLDLITNKYVLMAGALAEIGALAGKSIQLGIKDEMQKTSFEVLLDGKGAAKKMMDDIADYANKAPYQKTELSSAAQTMLGYGVAQEKVIPTMKMLGDIAMGDAGKLDSLALAFSQISSAGKLGGQDLMQLINAGFNPLGEMAKKTGLSIGELKDKMGEGAISFEMVEAAFKSATMEGGAFYDMSNKMGETLGGKLSTLTGKFNATLIDLYDVLQPMVVPIIDSLTRALDGVVPAFQRIVKGFQEGNPWLWGLTTVIGVIVGSLTAYKIALMAIKTWTTIVTVATKGWTIAQKLFNVALKDNPIGGVIMLISALVGVIIWAASKVTGWGDLWQHTWNGAKLLFKAFVEATKQNFLSLQNLIMMGIDTMKIGWLKFKSVFGFGNKDENKAAIAQINADIAARKRAIINGHKEVARLGIESAKEFKRAMESLSLKKDRPELNPKTDDGFLTKLKKMAKKQKGQSEDTDENVFATLKSEGLLQGSEEQIKKQIEELKKQRLKSIVGSNEWNRLGRQIEVLERRLSGKSVGTSSVGREQVSRVTGAGQQVRNITVNIDSFVKGGINTENTTMQRMDTQELERWFNEMFHRIVRNLEMSQG